NNVPVSPSLSVLPFHGLSTKVADRARENFSDLILVPWSPHSLHTHAAESSQQALVTAPVNSRITNLFHRIFNFGAVKQPSSAGHSQFVRGIFAKSTVDVALFVDRGRSRLGHFSKSRVFLPFFGGPDDRLALTLVVQLCAHPMTTATVIRVTKSDRLI